MCVAVAHLTSHLLVDLPYIYSTEGKIKEPNLAAEAGQGVLSAVTSYARGDMVSFEYCSGSVLLLINCKTQGGVFSSVSGLLKTATGSTQRAERKTRETKTSPADVVRAVISCYLFMLSSHSFI